MSKSTEEKDKKRKEDRKHEDSQVEKLVKPSPKKKPPRTDRQNRRMKVQDPDLDSSDKDLSMNRKDIGGSCRVLVRYLVSFEVDESKLDEVVESLETPESESTPYQWDMDQEEAAKSYYDLSIVDLQAKIDQDPRNEVLLRALELKTQPLPPGWDFEECFQEGCLTLKARYAMRKHMKCWDLATFVQNQTFFNERYLNVSLTSGEELREDYYQALSKIVGEALSELQTRKDAPLTDVSSELAGVSDGSELYEPSVHDESLAKRIQDWTDRARSTSWEVLDAMLEDIAVKIKNISRSTVLYHWLAQLKLVLEGSIRMQKSTPKQSSSQLPEVSTEPSVRFPKSRELRGPDYVKILVQAYKIAMETKSEYRLTNLDPTLRASLDMAIHDMDEGYYQHKIDAPTYTILLGLLHKPFE